MFIHIPARDSRIRIHLQVVFSTIRKDTMPQLNALVYNPLLRGQDQTVGQSFQRGDCRGSLLVTDPPRHRRGTLVYACACQCRQPNCPVHVDADGAFLVEAGARSAGICSLAHSADIVPFAGWQTAFSGLNILTEAQYASALHHGSMPKGSPVDPAVYHEFSGWAKITGDPDYHSDAELANFLRQIDVASFSMLSEVGRYRFLAHARYWDRVVDKAKALGIDESNIVDKIAVIRQALDAEVFAHQEGRPVTLRGSTMEKVSRNGDEGGQSTPQQKPSGKAATPRNPKDADLSEIRDALQWTSDAYENIGGDLAVDTWHDWLAWLWNTLDREDVLHGDGVHRVREEILVKLHGSAAPLVKAFNDQIAQVISFRENGRNWMQAYAMWYTTTHRCWINFSDPGLGKTRTVPALVSALDILVTIYIGPMRILQRENLQFPREVAFEDSQAVIHFPDDPIPTTLEAGKHHYILVNPEKFQLGDRTDGMINRLLELNPGLVVFDEAHLVGLSSNDPEPGAGEMQAIDRPRSRELRRFIDDLAPSTRIGLMTGTPIRCSVQEGQALFSLIGVDCGDIDGDISYINAIALRGRLQQHGFRFHNYRIPELEQYVIPFNLPEEIADRIRRSSNTLSHESLRIPFAMQAVEQAKGVECYRVTDDGLVPVVLDFDPLQASINPVFYTTFVNGTGGPQDQIEQYLDQRGQKYYRCTGSSEEAELAEYQVRKDGALVASQPFATGIDGAHRVSDTLVTLGLPWHHAGHKQLIARLRRQGAMKPNGEETLVIREFIPVALNASYDVRRFLKVYNRREFSDCLLDGRIASSMTRPEHELRGAFETLIGRAEKGVAA
jgi:hypothetical protein